MGTYCRAQGTPLNALWCPGIFKLIKEGGHQTKCSNVLADDKSKPKPMSVKASINI